jgi:hypothetical protein
MRLRSAAWRRPWWFVPTVIVAVGALAAGLVVGVQLFSGWGAAPASSAGSAVPVHVVRGRTVKVPVMHPYRAPPVSWPAATSATAVITPAPEQAKAARLAAGPSAGSARAGDLPVWVGPPDTAAAKAIRPPKSSWIWCTRGLVCLCGLMRSTIRSTLRRAAVVARHSASIRVCEQVEQAADVRPIG